MGSSSSKESSPAPPHVWKGSSPASVSHEMLEKLQSSPETDTTRAQTLELQIQARVADELRKLQTQQDDALRQVRDDMSAAPAGEDKQDQQPSRESVAREVAALRRRLDERRQVRELPEPVQAARGEVVRCLLEHDRRPLDCWREVERFREEVRRLEKGWVDKVVS